MVGDSSSSTSIRASTFGIYYNLQSVMSTRASYGGFKIRNIDDWQLQSQLLPESRQQQDNDHFTDLSDCTQDDLIMTI